ncbi:MAG: HEAT repeat domain-containing protein [Elusimicrobia bacterium]|nr:HEAT repeat domain-containing protein [Elusimicrobiota bacterium]
MSMEFLRCSRYHSGGSGPNLKATLLGKTPRYAPDRSFDTLHVRLELEIDFAARSAAGLCATRVKAYRDGVRSLEFDAVDLSVSSAAVDGRPVKIRREKEKLVLPLPRPLSAGQEAEAVVRYRVVRPKAGLHFVYPGPHNPKNPVQVWSQSQPEDARYWFPCHDSPHEKATSELKITVPEGFRAVSNGTLAETVTRGKKISYHWKMLQPHSLYLISLAAGKFAEIEERWEDIPVTYYCEKGRERDARRGLGKTPKAMEFFSKMTGIRYPYEKYAQVAVAEYPGGMEHTTATTQTDAVLVDEVAALDNDMDTLMAHELAHQWFGDLVTCRDWSHAWLNEGFATYFEVLFQEHDKGRDMADYELHQNKRIYFDEDARRYRRPIVCSTFKYPWILFDRHTYEKGSWILHMLRHELGDDLWWKAVNHYLTCFRDRSVETSDLIQAVEEISGRNLRSFFDQWVFKSGYPRFRVQYTWDPGSKKGGLWILQTQPVSEESPLFKVPVDIRFTGRGWVKTFTEVVSDKEHHFQYRLPAPPVNAEFDPEHRILKKLDFQKPQAHWRHQLLEAPRAQSRLEAARDVARWRGEGSVSLLEKAARRESFWGAGTEMIRALGSIESEKAFAALKGLLKLEHPKMRRAAVDALGAYKRPENAKIFLSLSSADASLHVRSAACRALGALQDKRFSGTLKRNLGKDSYRGILSSGALQGLALTRAPGLLQTLHKACLPPRSYWGRLSAMRALSEYAPMAAEVVPWLCEMSSDPDERINLAAIHLLGELEDFRALDTLAKALKSPNSRVRVYAEEAIAHIRAGIEPPGNK